VAVVAVISSLSGSIEACPLQPSKPRALVLWPWRASGSTGEITRSAATLRAIRKLPSVPCSRSWPTTAANSRVASATVGVSARPARTPSTAWASRTRASTSAALAAWSSQSICGLARLAYSSPPAPTPRSSTSSTSSATLSTPRMAAPNSVTVSIVATASYNGVESNTRRTPTSPACLAAATVTSKIHAGRSEAASLARMSTSTV
jgi:hypothetical protein